MGVGDEFGICMLGVLVLGVSVVSIHMSVSTRGANCIVTNWSVMSWRRYTELPKSVMRSSFHMEAAMLRSSDSHWVIRSRCFWVTGVLDVLSWVMRLAVNPNSTVPPNRLKAKCDPLRLRILARFLLVFWLVLMLLAVAFNKDEDVEWEMWEGWCGLWEMRNAGGLIFDVDDDDDGVKD